MTQWILKSLASKIFEAFGQDNVIHNLKFVMKFSALLLFGPQHYYIK